MTDKKLYSFADITYTQWTARLNELRRMKVDLDKRIQDTERMCGHWQDKVNEEHEE